jgi:hypothetical protein
MYRLIVDGYEVIGGKCKKEQRFVDIYKMLQPCTMPSSFFTSSPFLILTTLIALVSAMPFFRNRFQPQGKACHPTPFFAHFTTDEAIRYVTLLAVPPVLGRP